MGYQALARKYRPQRFTEVLGQEAIVTTLLNALEQDRVAHAYLFSGPRGTGKTTLARLLAKALNCEKQKGEPCNACTSCREITAGSSLDVIEVDGASNRGIDDIRGLNETAGYAAASGGYKIYIIDEVHMLTKEAFNALLKTLEEPPERVKFFFATTEPHKVPATIVSRCQRFQLRPLSDALIVKKLTQEASEMEATLSGNALQLIATAAQGGMRDAESILDQVIAFHGSPIEEEDVASILGFAPSSVYKRLDKAIVEADLKAPFEITEQLVASGCDLGHFLTALIDHHRTQLLRQLGGADSPLTKEQRIALLDALFDAQADFKNRVCPRLAIEMILSKVVRAKQRVPIETLVQRLEAIEKAPAPAPAPKQQQVAAHPSHHDTVMRFAAVELEGQLKR